MIEVRWHGRGGQGTWTVARLLGMAATQFEGRYALAFPSFGPERRGAPVLGFTKIDDQKIRDRSEVRACDYIVVLDETLVDESTGSGLKAGGVVILNSSAPDKYTRYFPDATVRRIDATSMALETLGVPITNTAMLGALVAVSGIVSLDSINRAINQEMRASLRVKNIETVKRAHDQLKGVA